MKNLSTPLKVVGLISLGAVLSSCSGVTDYWGPGKQNTFYVDEGVTNYYHDKSWNMQRDYNKKTMKKMHHSKNSKHYHGK